MYMMHYNMDGGKDHSERVCQRSEVLTQLHSNAIRLSYYYISTHYW